MRYVQYYTSENMEALATDGYCPLDARFSLYNAMAQAREHGLKLNKDLNKGFTHFQIRRAGGNNIFSSWRPETKLMRL